MFKFKPFQGPMQFTFVDPDSGLKYEENSKAALMTRIKSYRSQNELPDIEFLDQVLENYWCMQRENVGRCQKRQLQRGLLGYIKGGVSLLKSMIYKSYVSKEEANKRAAICTGCKYNVLSKEKGLIAWTDQIAYHTLIDDQTTDYDAKLGSCEVCSCPLRVKVHMGGDLGISEDMKKKLPDYCWQK